MGWKSYTCIAPRSEIRGNESYALLAILVPGTCMHKFDSFLPLPFTNESSRTSRLLDLRIASAC